VVTGPKGRCNNGEVPVERVCPMLREGIVIHLR
jgi:hypothetical protein